MRRQDGPGREGFLRNQDHHFQFRREYKRRRGTVPTRYQPTLRPLNDVISREKLHDLNTSERAVGEEKKDGSMASEEGGDAKSSGSEDLQVVPVSAPVEETIFVASQTSIESDDSYGLFSEALLSRPHMLWQLRARLRLWCCLPLRISCLEFRRVGFSPQGGPS